MINGFWDFSLRVYALPGVANALLDFQDQQGGDVNVVLFCAWHAASGRGALPAEQIRELDAVVAPWRERVIKPLRAVRELIGDETAFATLANSREARAKVLDAELACEQVAQQLLESLVEGRPADVSETAAATAFQASLQAYCTYLDLPADVQSPVAAALRTAFRNN